MLLGGGQKTANRSDYSMKIIHVPFCFHPDPVGGTEVHVETLARHLQEDFGVDVLVAAPGPANQSYEHKRLRVRRFLGPERVTDVRELYDEGDPQSASAFANLVEEERPDVVHIHAFTRGVSLLHIRAAKQRSIPVVFTYHTPTVSCQRGTLLRWGDEICDGRLDRRLCASCTLQGLGLNRTAARAVGSLPPSVGRSIGRLGFQGRALTALRTTELVELRHTTFRALMAEVDHIVVECEWAWQLLRDNGVAASKITISRVGLLYEASDKSQTSQPKSDGRRGNGLRIAFLGRFDPTKGVHILIEAFRLASSLEAQLDVYGITQGSAGSKYADKLKRMAAGDTRISFLPPVSSDRVVEVIKEYDLLAVPSQWLESGPLVVLDAFAAGIPVVGSCLGGIRELVRSDVDGLLVDPRNVSEWAQAFEHLATDRARLARLRAGIQRPRTMAKVAAEAMGVYSGVIGSGSVFQPLSA
jgi:glycosyltransferase involved in cell wall biosynthesis